MSKSRELLEIAVPAVFESLVTVFISAIDTRMISVLGKDAISAVAFASQPKLLFFQFSLRWEPPQAYLSRSRSGARTGMRPIAILS